ncbi:MAG TPA: threonine synthase [Blastocatellia bacterium]|nr:threonine synthase [Blastocatellia bacterium]
MSAAIGFQCVACGRRLDSSEAEYVCPGCGGNLDVLYDYDQIAKSFGKAQLAADRNLTIWRYRALLPIEATSPVPPLTVGWTPLYDCKPLGTEYGIKQLLIKDDGRNPTGSFKDRPSALAVVKAREAGVGVVTTASSGNAGSALAGMCASMGMRSVVFVPAHAPAAKVAQLQIYGAVVVLVEGSYDQAYDLCLQAGHAYGWYQRSTGYNPFMSEGKKTAALEMAEQLNWNVPDKVFVAMGDGCIMGGLWKGFRELKELGMIDRLPQMIGVQSENASALVDAVNGDGIVGEGPARTIADSINVGRPRDATKAVRAMRESGGLGVKVSDDEILTSIGRLARATGIFAEPAAAAAFAGFAKMADSGRVSADERVLLMLTGNGLKDVGAARKAAAEPIRIRPDFDELARALAKNDVATL